MGWPVLLAKKKSLFWISSYYTKGGLITNML